MSLSTQCPHPALCSRRLVVKWRSAALFAVTFGSLVLVPASVFGAALQSTVCEVWDTHILLVMYTYVPSTGQWVKLVQSKYAKFAVKGIFKYG